MARVKMRLLTLLLPEPPADFLPDEDLPAEPCEPTAVYGESVKTEEQRAVIAVEGESPPKPGIDAPCRVWPGGAPYSRELLSSASTSRFPLNSMDVPERLTCCKCLEFAQDGLCTGNLPSTSPLGDVERIQGDTSFCS